ncbi:MAG: DUF4118 domain-containing protein [Ruminococcus sp.]|nr:DUF4118 domain-containing protein [Ruminococcus sp.]
MKKYIPKLKEALFTLFMLVIAFFINLFIEYLFDTRTHIPMIFVLSVFIISSTTQGYFWGITASLISVLAVNYAFTFPYYAFDLMTPECLSSAVVMLIVAIMTGTLTTQLKLQEKIKAESDKERMRANLLRAVSHDLRTPLTSIYGSSSAIIENYDSLSKEQHLKLLEDVREDAEWLIRMVENLLSVTRIDGQKVQVVKTPTVLEELIDTVLVKFKKRCPNQHVQVEIPDDFISIPMDAMLIEQVLINILENAVDHAKGMTKLIFRVTVEENKALFYISDNGCGIPPERMSELFTGYLDRNTSTTDSSRSNMGIGLSVCYTIIKAHGSEIFACNNPEGGASFYFSLEMEEADYEQ